MPLRSIAFLAYFLGSSAAALAIPMAGVLCYVVLYHVNPQTTWWGLALEPLGIRYSFTCGICLILGALFNLHRLRFGRSFLHPVEWGILALFLAMLLSAVWGVEWNYRTDFVLDKMTKVFLFTFAMSHVVVTRKRVWQLVVLLVLMTLYLGHTARNAPLSAFTHNRLDGIGGPDFRESAGLAIHLIALMPFVAVVFKRKQWWAKALAFFAACYGMNAFLLCRARSAFVAGVIAAVFALLYIPKKHRTWLVGILVLACIGGIVLSDTWFWKRMETILDPPEQRDTSASSRLVIWVAAWEMLKDNPLGVGVGQFERNIGRYAPEGADINDRDAHNTFVLCAAETGILGLLALIGTMVAAWLTLGTLNRKARNKLASPDLYRMLIFANRLAIIVYVSSGMFVSRFYTEGMWMLVVLPVCISRAIENEVRETAAEAVRLVQLLPDWAVRELVRGRPAPA